jgi:hypothetical protein
MSRSDRERAGASGDDDINSVVSVAVCLVAAPR